MTDMSSHAIKQSTKKDKVEISRKVEIWIETGSDQCNRKKISTKTGSTGKVNYRSETNTSIN